MKIEEDRDIHYVYLDWELNLDQIKPIRVGSET